jgi:NhaP-type Na+/H+ or K+/H+ antiporter
MSLFFLLIVALLFGRFVGYFYLPSLLGMLLAGILIRNVDAFAEFWQINSDWDQVLRQFAFILILIRCGVNLEPEALRQSLTTFISLGLLSTTAEAAAIILAAYYLFEIPLATSLLFGYILSATSPAVTIPAIISLQEKGYGRDKGIPTTILASVSIDNIYCITAFTVVGSIVFTRNGK